MRIKDCLIFWVALVSGAAAWGGALAAQPVSPFAFDNSNGDNRDSDEYQEWIEVRGNRFRLYGFPRLDVIYTDSKLFPNNQFPFWVFSEDFTVQSKNNDEELDIHPRLTRLGVMIERDSIPRLESASLKGRIELDFQNGGSESREAVRMRHAYFEISSENGWSVLAGQTWDVIAPLYPSVNSDSLMWNAGNLGDRRPQIRTTYKTALDEESDLVIAFAMARQGAINNRDLDGDGTSDGIDSGKPQLQGRIGADDLFGGLCSLGVWGHYGWDDVDRPVGGKTDFNGVGYGIDVKLRLADSLRFAGEFWAGKNLDDVRGGIGQGVNTTTGEEIDSRGGWIELQVDMTDWWTSVIGTTLDNPSDADLDPAATGGGGPRERNTTFYLSNHLNLGGGLKIGLEYIHWETDYGNGLDDGDANRVNLWTSFSF